MIDLHLHSTFSYDGEGEPENYIKKAIESGDKIIGFSEHYDYDAIAYVEDNPLCEIEKYLSFAEKLQKKYQDATILKGIELGYGKNVFEHYNWLNSNFPFDYVINSVHTINGSVDAYFPKFFDGKTLKQAYAEYFDTILESVYATYDYQIIGHIGYVARYNNHENKVIDYKEYKTVIDEILSAIIKRGKCLEINTSTGTSGWDYMPSTPIIEKYFNLGGKDVCFGSDSHKVENYSKNFSNLKKYLNELGVKKACYFKNKQKIYYDF